MPASVKSSGKDKKKKSIFGFRRRGKKTAQEPVAGPQKMVQEDPAAELVEPPSVVRVSSDLKKHSKKNGVEPQKPKRKPKGKLKSSWLARRSFFIKMTDQAFDLVDADDSGEVDEKELYSGLLLIHLKLGCYAGPAACRPVDRNRVHDIFERMDVDDSGSLDRTEFREVMTILFSNVLLRVVVQWSMTLMIVPLIAQYILDAVEFLFGKAVDFTTTLDEHSFIFDAIEVSLEKTRDYLWSKTPSLIKAFVGYMGKLIAMVPESVWETVPLTLLSCILGCLAVPWMIFKVDDYFQRLAHKSVEEEK